MIHFDNGGRLVEDVSELPNLAGSRSTYLDLETTSGDPKLDALNPWHHSFAAGICITADDAPGSWYVPVQHTFGKNLPRDAVINWLTPILNQSEEWVNHNIKYDAHVLANDLGIRPTCRLVDTLTLAKVVDSDRWAYGLDALSKAWLHEDIAKYEEAMQPYLHKNKDYGRIPTEVIGPYGCQDSLTERRLYKYIRANIHEECLPITNTEIELTALLLDVERTGMAVNPTELMTVELKSLIRMNQIDQRLEEIVGRAFRPHVNDDCFDVLCNQYGLPVLDYTEEGNPSFDKHAMAQYASHPFAPKEVVSLIMEYRHINTLLSFFVRPYQELNVDGILHPSYNQAVRTGRMSCKKPNSQQLSPDAKRLVHPRPGNTFVSIDYSQIEFRIIVHYIKDSNAIAAYHANPDTDFHTWVAEMCGIPRKPAKNVNFCMGYGGGKNKLVSMLETNMDLVGSLQVHVDKLLAEGKIKEENKMTVFNSLCKRRAEAVYNRYHDTLPGLKPTARMAQRVLEQRGYVRNIYRRHRNLPREAAHKAFNALCQSSAADLMKERTVAVGKAIAGTPIKIIASVHDETLFEMPHEIAQDTQVIRDLVHIMEHPSAELRIPIRCAVGLSKDTWVAAAKSAAPIAVGQFVGFDRYIG